MSKTPAKELAHGVDVMLTFLQEHLIAQRTMVCSLQQSIEPSVTISYKEVRSMTDRRRITNAFVGKFIRALERLELTVEHRPHHATFVITKPFEIMQHEFECFADLVEAIGQLNETNFDELND